MNPDYEYPDTLETKLNLFFGLVRYVVRQPMGFSEPRIYFGGTADSKQSKFETESLDGKIAVYAHSNLEAFAKLFLLRIVIDKNLNILRLPFDLVDEEDEMDEMDINTYVKGLKDDFVSSFAVDEEIIFEMVGSKGRYEKKIKRRDVMIYSLEDILREAEKVKLFKE